MADWTHQEVHNCMSRLRAGIPLDYDETAELLVSYGDLIAQRDTLAAELVALRAGLPRWKQFGNGHRLITETLALAFVWPTEDCWFADVFAGYRPDFRCDTREAAMLAVTEALGLPPCEVEGE